MFLRAKIASLEAVGGGSPVLGRTGDGSRQARMALGEAERLCSLDQALQGGLALGALHEIVAARPGDRAAATGFAWGLAAPLCRGSG